MTERTHEELKSLVAAYVLGAVPSEEVGPVRNHIMTCDECMAEAGEHAGAIDSLALAVEPIAVPAGFADRVMAQIAPVAERETAAAAAPRRNWFADWVRGRGLALAGGMAALVLLGVLGTGWIQARQDLSRTEDVLSALIHGEAIELRGERGAAAELVPTNEGAVMAVAGLPEAPGSHVYQLWYMKDGEPVSVGTFETRDSVVVMEVAESFDGYENAAVTVEPSGGSRQPTSDPVIASF
jgi:anti-sigma-K factor RskA